MGISKGQEPGARILPQRSELLHSSTVLFQEVREKAHTHGKEMNDRREVWSRPVASFSVSPVLEGASGPPEAK